MSVSVAFHLMFVQIVFSLVWVAEWAPFGKELLTRLTTPSLYYVYLLLFVYLFVVFFVKTLWTMDFFFTHIE